MPGPHYWLSGNTVEPDETFGVGAIARQPDAVALRSWAETCLPTLGGNETPLQLMGGWSPTRSAIVEFPITGSRRYFKCGDLAKPILGGIAQFRWFGIQLANRNQVVWAPARAVLRVTKRFAKAALGVAAQRGLHRQCVVDMLKREMKGGFVRFSKRARQEASARFNIVCVSRN